MYTTGTGIATKQDMRKVNVVLHGARYTDASTFLWDISRVKSVNLTFEYQSMFENICKM